MASATRLEVVHTRYTIGVPKDRAQALFEAQDPSLLDRLKAIPGISDVEYGGHSGPFVYLTIDDEADTPRKHDVICSVIDGALKEVAKAAKAASR